jgi:hypothetical protein
LKLKEKRNIYYIKNKENLLVKKRESDIIKNKEKNENYIRKSNYSFKDSESTRNYFESIAKLYHISELPDWYRISIDQLTRYGGIMNSLNDIMI